MLFNQISSNKNNQNVLIDGVKKNKIPHAQLFYGPIGTEKLKMALAYIQFIFCLNKKRMIVVVSAQTVKKTNY